MQAPRSRRRRPWERPNSIPGLLAHVLWRGPIRPWLVALSLAIVVIAAVSLHRDSAGPSPASSTPELSSPGGWDPVPPRLFAEGTGFVAVYDAGEGTPTVVRLDAEGRALGPPVQVQRATLMEAARFGSSVIIACLQPTPHDDLVRGEVTVWRFDPALARLTRLFRAERQYVTDRARPFIDVGDPDGFTVYWSSRHEARLRAQRFDAQGSPRGSLTISPSFGFGRDAGELVGARTDTTARGLYVVASTLTLVPELDPEFGSTPVPLTDSQSVAFLTATPRGRNVAVTWATSQANYGYLAFAEIDARGQMSRPKAIINAGRRSYAWVLTMTEHVGQYVILAVARGPGTHSLVVDPSGETVRPLRKLAESALSLSNLLWTGRDFAVLSADPSNSRCPISFTRLSEDASTLTPPRCCL